MSIRRVRGSFRSSQRRYGSTEGAKKMRSSSWIFKNDEWRLVYDDGDEVTLMYAKHEKVPMKDFGSEVRASMDIAHFLAQATLVLDVVETSLEGITDLLLTKLLEKDEPLCSVAEAKSILFTHDTCKYPLTCMCVALPAMLLFALAK
ncbi:uncharacterized protein LOC134768913 [Penaeus indicus]|uniref:uncharacterized protein LOC134768913 n=1 Tax=Penaeus indicus TaxID=29960 RepID=UPI00300CD1B2